VEAAAVGVRSLSVAAPKAGGAEAGGEAKSCAKCRRPIGGAFVVAKDKNFHTECFRCKTCATGLGGKAFLEQDDNYFCEKCYYAAFNPTCAHCNEVIKGQYLSALGKAWHADHFVCTECSKPFEGNQYHKHNNKPYCERHFNELFTDACAKCGLKIEGQVFEAMDKKYHLDCFVCSVGDHQIGAGVNFHMHEDRVYCPEHFEELFLHRCAGCGAIVKGQYVKVLDVLFHPGCWKCADCGSVIASDNCGQSGGKFYCKACVAKKGGGAAPAPAPAAKAAREVKGASGAPVGVFLTLTAIKDAMKELKKPVPDQKKIPAGFEVDKAEISLSDDDFSGYFRMDKATYLALPLWKRKRLREKVLA